MSLIPSRPLVDVEPVAAKQAAVGEPPAAVRVGQIGEADIAKRRLAAADQDRRAIEEQAIDAVGGEEGRRGAGAAFDEQRIDGVDRFGCGDRGPAFGGLAAGEQEFARAAIFQPGQAHVELRRVGVECPAPDEDRSTLRTLEMPVRAGAVAGDPAARPVGARDAAVERGRELERHERPPFGVPRPPGRHRGVCLGGQNVEDDLDPGRLQSRDALAVGARVGILRRDHDARRAQQSACRYTRPARAGVGARFERDIGGRPARRVARRRKRHRFGMRAATRLRPAARDDPAMLYEQAADIGVGRRRRPAAPRQRNRKRHPVGVGGRPLHQG